MTRDAGQLQAYRVLDLSDESGLLCGKILADLGADVIKVEQLGGDPAREIGPFYQDEPHPEKSLYWFAFNLNKRGITLDFKTGDGQAMLKSLVETADFLVESFAPGYLDRLGLGYEELSLINPRLIFVSITPFGQTGPYRDYKASDLVIQALGGRIHRVGYPDRTPVRIGVPQAYLQGSIHAAVGALMALQERHRHGLGQRVDVSMQEASARQFQSEPIFWFYERVRLHRLGNRWQKLNFSLRRIWDCADGEVGFGFFGGRVGRLMKPLVDWMIEEGMASTVGKVDWDNLDLSTLTTSQIEEMESDFNAFFLRQPKKELLDQAVKRRFMVSPVNTPRDILEDEHLAARNFFAKVEHPELGSTFLYPSVPFRFSTIPMRQSKRAPMIGEHNSEVYSEVGPKMTSGCSSPPTAYERNESALPLDGRDAEESAQHAPLSGIKVLDFTWFIAGPLMTECLGEHGAQVVRVESERAPDIMRLSEPYKDHKPGLNNGLGFPIFNSGKLSICLDLGNKKAREIVRRLVAWADVVAENFTVGTMKKWQLDYAELRKINPRIIMLSSNAHGQTGPRASLAGTGLDLQARAGFVSVTGWPDRTSVIPHTGYSDWVAPWYGVIAILAALEHRRRTGEGQYIELSQYEAGVNFLSLALLDYSFNKREWRKRGNQSSRACPHGVYGCKGEDRWCAIAVYTEKEWASFCRVLDNPGWTRDGKFASLSKRKEHEEELDELVGQWTRRFTPEDVMNRLQRAGVAAGVVNSGEDALDDPQLKARQFFSLLECSSLGPALHYGWPYRFSRSQGSKRGAPSLGEHTHYVCEGLLGMSDEEFASLMEEGVFV